MNIFEMVKNFKSLQNELGDIEATGSSGADMVVVTLNGKFEVKELTIADEIIKKYDSTVVSQLVKAAFHDALQKIQQKIQVKMGGAGMGGILGTILGKNNDSH